MAHGSTLLIETAEPKIKRKSSRIKSRRSSSKSSRHHSKTKSSSKSTRRRHRKTSSKSSRRRRRRKTPETTLAADAHFSSDGDNFMGDFQFQELEFEPVRDFVCMTQDDIISEQEKTVKSVAELLSVKKTAASALLRHFQWKKEILLTRYFENPDKVLKEAGVRREIETNIHPQAHDGAVASSSNASSTSKRSSFLRISAKLSVAGSKGKASSGGGSKSEIQAMLEKIANQNGGLLSCSICGDDDLEIADVYALACKHYFCRDCWAQYLRMKITDGESGDITCPGHKCGLRVDEEAVRALVPADIFQRYRKFLMHSFVDTNDQVKWCPAAGCGNAVNIDWVKNQTVVCSCGYRFCFQCGEQAHQPATCEQVRAWSKKSQDESETNNWLTANTQACPKCGTKTEKNGGCNHMTCKKCSHEYCWMCMKDWKGHQNFYNCSRYEKAKKKEAKRASKKGKKMSRHQLQQEHRAKLERYLHYYDQFLNHDRTGQFEKLREAARQNVEEWKSQYGYSAEVRFIEKATETLIECRRALKWSYVVSYYIADANPQKSLFEFVQKDLENIVQKLTLILEAPNIRKLEAVDNTRLAERRLTALLSWETDHPGTSLID
mmetsp:Transcript_12686/g.19179  ORF Transcript_12686/g.19179 Transcript_12686/m.19179 type:complete len:607 (-) Transcript_12686:35-1855(-)